MYQINKEKNNILSLEQKSFSELGFRERDHLQEWIAKNPEVLGDSFLLFKKNLMVLMTQMKGYFCWLLIKILFGSDISKFIYSISSGVLVSSIFYFIVVYIPIRQRKNQTYLNKYFSNEDAKQSILDLILMTKMTYFK